MKNLEVNINLPNLKFNNQKRNKFPLLKENNFRLNPKDRPRITRRDLTDNR